MNSLSQRTRSPWMDFLTPQAPPLAGDLTTDIVVVGAGLAGMTAAYLLAEAGREVVVLDPGPPGGGMTARTTAHLASALDDRWADLIDVRGEKHARLAAAAHAGAIDLIEQIQATAGIDCDFARVDGWLLPAEPKHHDELREEYEAARKLGLEGVALQQASPYGNGLCLRFQRQGRFHPLKYLAGLRARIEARGGRFFAARALSAADGEPVVVELDGDRSVTGRAAIVCTNAPINDRLAIHTKQAPYRTYAIAAPVPRGSVPDALLWDTADPYHYVRLQPMGERDLLIVGGEDHKSGQATDMPERLARLEDWARSRFPGMAGVAWRWSGQVMESIDYLGYLGRNPGDKHVHIMSGDSGMGMTHATIGARIIADQILGRSNPWEEAFVPGRISLKAAGSYASENLNVAAQMADHVTAGEVDSTDEIEAGSGAIVRRGLHKVAAFRDDDGTLHECSAVCPHVGCVVAWNNFEKCWDCPCHGSQFTPEGHVINGPAKVDLAPVEGGPAARPGRDQRARASRPH